MLHHSLACQLFTCRVKGGFVEGSVAETLHVASHGHWQDKVQPFLMYLCSGILQAACRDVFWHVTEQAKQHAVASKGDFILIL